ncbi:MarR family winged helix-turn-helix transcriptional regulator [Mycobacterium avium]|uniref:MarR family winged helix-turn-helix transcriptional regulator n=1 Tax=Mycobacterium avium TaxID=1764 RepID=UPI000A047A04|nr:MarR family transcriptional regulator [Mycobacterium avium]
MPSADDLNMLSASDSQAWGGLLRTHKLIMAAMSQELEDQHGLALTSYDVLRHIALADGQRLRMSQLAEQVMITRSGLTGVVGRLEAAGLVRRDSTDCIDGRGAYASITGSGWKVLLKANDTITTLINQLFLNHLTEHDLADLRRVWRKLGTVAQGPGKLVSPRSQLASHLRP